ncbi:MAG: thioredoxin-disulfide reductase [candidate division KSB1 bacterium]|nr:thioredoxin-disulfide reductase [candidate division KSB1 bacterium]MDZ7339931.1 thioredoxin-disulfide reductase [candidate division KSB1 bacterium]
MENVIILGTGPAGLTAAIYAARAELSPLVLKGDQPGGQVTITEKLDNFPGFPEGITGYELFQGMEQQAIRFGANIVADAAIAVDFKTQPFKIQTREQVYETRSVIIATGSDPRKLNVPGEKEGIGKGVSYCATCDGFFFRGKKVVVVGGGDSAVEEGLFLTRFASTVTLIHRRDRLRAHAHLQSRAQANEKMRFVWDSVVTEVILSADGIVTGVRLQNVKTNAESVLETDGVFVFIGHIPNTQIFQGQLEMDESGIIITDRRQRTSVAGVFAAGDVQDAIYRQAITSAGSGCMAAMEAERFLAEQGGTIYPGKVN